MAGSPQFKVYTPDREYIAACKYASDAAAIASLRGDGSTVRWDHRTVLWTEGAEEIPAAESYDRAAEIILERHSEMNRKAFAKYHKGA